MIDITPMPGELADYDFTWGAAPNGVPTLYASRKDQPNRRWSLTGSEMLRFDDAVYVVDYAKRRMVDVREALDADGAEAAPTPDDPIVSVSITTIRQSGRKDNVGSVAVG